MADDMYSVSWRTFVYPVVALVGFLVLLELFFFFLLMGPIGWMFVVIIVAGLSIGYRTWKEGFWQGGDGDGAQLPVNCPDCGSPNPPEADSCDHCEAALDEPDATPDAAASGSSPAP